MPMPPREVHGLEQTAELVRLLDALPTAIARAKELLHKSSIHDPAYLAADAEVAKMLARINALMNPTDPDDHGKR
jgi:hypothetical protein